MLEIIKAAKTYGTGKSTLPHIASGLPEYEFNVRAFCIALASFGVPYEVFMFLGAKRIKRIPLKEMMQEEWQYENDCTRPFTARL